MRDMKFDRLNVIELEATCWETREESNQNTSEIIEIGIAQINLRTGVVEKSEGIIVKTKKSKVSPFCTKLTTLTQADVDAGITFSLACQKLIDEYDTQSLPWISFGNYDNKMIAKQCAVTGTQGIKNPMSDQHLNVKLLASLMDTPHFRRAGMDKVLTNLGLSLEGTHHRGVDDARNIAKIFLKLTRK